MERKPRKQSKETIIFTSEPIIVPKQELPKQPLQNLKYPKLHVSEDGIRNYVDTYVSDLKKGDIILIPHPLEFHLCNLQYVFTNPIIIDNAWVVNCNNIGITNKS